MASIAKWSQTVHVAHVGDYRFLGEPHLTTEGLKQKSRSDWSGTQRQVWSNPQFPPQKTKFPYWINTTKKGRVTYDATDGKWYFEDELILTYEANKRNVNRYHDGWTGGKILMTKQEASQMGLSHGDILNYYKEDKNTPLAFQFFEYRKDGSIIGLKKKALLGALI